MTLKIATVVGARPQFVKAAVLSRLIQQENNVNEVLIHTGQHFDDQMSRVFFTEMEIPKPAYNLAINRLSHGAMTGRMIEKIEAILLIEKPDVLLIYGDTNSTLAGAIAASKIGIPIAHVEAGLRSFDMAMPEEINRVLADRISTFLFAPTVQAMKNMRNEGFELQNKTLVNTGDIMLDAAMYYAGKSFKGDPLPHSLPDRYVLCTLHREENTNNPDRIKQLVDALNQINEEIPVVLPLHPRTKSILEKQGIAFNFSTWPPVSYLQMIPLIQKCSLVMTDSGGLQKEAYFFKKLCLTLRDTTEWTELVEAKCNLLVGANQEKIIKSFEKFKKTRPDFSANLYGDGRAGQKILETLKTFYTSS